MKLLTLTRRELKACLAQNNLWGHDLSDEDFDRQYDDEPPKEIVSTLSYSLVKRLPNIGAKGLNDIVVWLAEDGFTLRDMPEQKPVGNVSHTTIQKAIALLERQGYKIT